MADNEVLASSRFYLEIDGMTGLVVKKVSGLQVTLEAAGDMKSFGVTKGGKSKMQATVSGVTSAALTVEFVATVEEKSLHDWFRASHPAVGPLAGGFADSGGEGGIERQVLCDTVNVVEEDLEDFVL